MKFSNWTEEDEASSKKDFEFIHKVFTEKYGEPDRCSDQDDVIWLNPWDRSGKLAGCLWDKGEIMVLNGVKVEKDKYRNEKTYCVVGRVFHFKLFDEHFKYFGELAKEEIERREGQDAKASEDF